MTETEQTTRPDVPPPGVGLTCPLCAYDLRGLTTPRCPECGFAFTWAELLDERRDRHPWLFEHGRRRPVRSFLATFARTAWAWRFWRRVTPANPVHGKRLATYSAVAAGLVVAVAAAVLSAAAVGEARTTASLRKQYAKFYSPADLDRFLPPPWSSRFVGQLFQHGSGVGGNPLGPAAVLVVAWPWLTVGALLIFQASMRRAKVGPRHVVRVAVYGCDFGLLVLLAVAVLFGPRAFAGPVRTLTAAPLPAWLGNGGLCGVGGPLDVFSQDAVIGRWNWSSDYDGLMWVPLVLACGVIAGYRLTAAYARYMRFDRPLLVAAASQVIVVLVVLVFLLQVTRLL